MNKVDNNQRIDDSYQFYSLGLGEIYCISSMTGSGTGDMLDALVENFPKSDQEIEELNLPSISVVGRPNVGKSSFVNALLGVDRNIVTDVAGTTRDAIDSYFENDTGKYCFIDTAGMRRKSKVDDAIEKYSNMPKEVVDAAPQG